MYGSEVTDDGAYLLLTASKDTAPMNLLYTYSLDGFDPQPSSTLLSLSRAPSDFVPRASLTCRSVDFSHEADYGVGGGVFLCYQ